jgi:hypothetical protein
VASSTASGRQPTRAGGLRVARQRLTSLPSCAHSVTQPRIALLLPITQRIRPAVAQHAAVKLRRLRGHLRQKAGSVIARLRGYWLRTRLRSHWLRTRLRAIAGFAAQSRPSICRQFFIMILTHRREETMEGPSHPFKAEYAKSNRVRRRRPIFRVPDPAPQFPLVGATHTKLCARKARACLLTEWLQEVQAKDRDGCPPNRAILQLPG